MKRRNIVRAAALTLLAASAIAVWVYTTRPRYLGQRAGFADENYIDSKKCQACHAEHYDSWARTHHSRMTQEARPQTVQGDFERDNVFEYLGVKARMEKRDGKFSMALSFPDGRTQTHSIDRTVGSRRAEQYLTRQDGQYLRLPLAYDLVNRRWMSLNGAFFYPDSTNYFQHQAQWDANCVFCHNVKAQPNYNPQTKKFNTEVAELGIACGACHGQGAAHADAAASPLTSSKWRLTNTAEKDIVNPLNLSPEKSLMVCGHCHGQRVPEPIDRIQEILGKGDPYNAGDDLSKFYKPVTRETKVGHFSFANRFWANGSPRLTAYEYQGILRSKCFTAGEGRHDRINCLTCHSMHDGDPKGQITPQNLTDKTCLSCHSKFSAPAALSAHTHHPQNSTGSRCYNCHMPRTVYGIMGAHRSHEITIPDATLTVSQAVPNACNQCHVDKSANWAINSSREFWPARFANSTPGSDPQFDLPEGPRALFAADALTRALAAEAMGGGGPMKTDANWAAPFLIEAFSDNYPIVRYFAAQGLSAGNPNLPKPDYLGTPEARNRVINQWLAQYPHTRESTAKFAAKLREHRVNVDLEVGE